MMSYSIIRKLCATLLIYDGVVNCKVFTKCEFGLILIENGIPIPELWKYICLASFASQFNSSLIRMTSNVYNRNNDSSTQSRVYGIFQLPGYWNCIDEIFQDQNRCTINCADLVDDNLADNIACAKKILQDHSKFKHKCANQSHEQYTQGCDFPHGKSNSEHVNTGVAKENSPSYFGNVLTSPFFIKLYVIISITAFVLLLSFLLYYKRKWLSKRNSININEEPKSDVVEMTNLNTKKKPDTEDIPRIPPNLRGSGFEILGKGNFGNVYLATLETLGHVALKTVKRGLSDDERAKRLESLRDEAKVMSLIGHHPNIVQLIGVSTIKIGNDLDDLCLVLEYCTLGGLRTFLKSHRNGRIPDCPKNSKDSEGDSDISITDLISYAQQIAEAMKYLSEKNIIHADLAARNVLLLNRKIVKVADFGLSKRMSCQGGRDYTDNHQEIFPWQWWAIESLMDFTFTLKSDVWSYGVTLWEIFTLGQTPNIQLSYGPDYVQKLKDGKRLSEPSLAVDINLYRIMTQCWMEDPHERPTFQNVCNQLHDVQNEIWERSGNYAPMDELMSKK